MHKLLITSNILLAGLLVGALLGLVILAKKYHENVKSDFKLANDMKDFSNEIKIARLKR